MIYFLPQKGTKVVLGSGTDRWRAYRRDKIPAVKSEILAHFYGHNHRRCVANPRFADFTNSVDLESR